MAVKRIVAVEGDEVRTKAPYPLTHEVVPVGHVWLEGENPDGTKSIDSNTYGPVSKSLIMGKVKAVIWPWPKAGLIRWQDYHGSPRVTENKVAVIPRPIHKG
jgi:inner membrane protease subunit 2